MAELSAELGGPAQNLRWAVLKKVLIAMRCSLRARIMRRETFGDTHCRDRARSAPEHDGQAPRRLLPIAVQRSLALLLRVEEAQLIHSESGAEKFI